MNLPIEEQDIRFEDIVCKYHQRYKTDVIRTDEMMSVRISDLFILRNEGFDVNDVISLWEERGWIVINQDYKKGNMGGVEFAEFELTDKFPKESRLKLHHKTISKSHQNKKTPTSINIHNSFNKDVKESFNKTHPKVHLSKLSLFGIIVGVFTIIGGGFAALDYFNVTPAIEKSTTESMDNGEVEIFYIDVSESDFNQEENYYKRTVKIRNNSQYDQSGVHISIQGTKEIRPLGPPWPEGGGMIATQYIKSEGTTYETEIRTIPTQKFVKITLASSEPFEVEVKVYK